MAPSTKRRSGNAVLEFTLIGIPMIFVLISVFELLLLGMLLSGILRMVFGFNLLNEPQDSPIMALLISAFFLVFLAAAALGLRNNRRWRFRIYRGDG